MTRTTKGARRKSTRKLGRPTVYSVELADRLINEVRRGSVPRACKKLRLAESTFYDWVIRGEGGEKPFSDFSERYLKAKDERVHYLEEKVVETGDANTALKLLANIQPKRHSARLSLHVSTELEGAMRRLEQAFLPADPAGYEKAVRALAGSTEPDEEPET